MDKIVPIIDQNIDEYKVEETEVNLLENCYSYYSSSSGELSSNNNEDSDDDSLL
ncbi:unnamed protein product [Moneuplotes crassus]|uniref:Uncharacterized protein n=1 Tax=Euplotes crassus TaxID=5936 RepID=A0AAD1UQF0_EUPCR|nr:unnamed protein product [Moneuplotes crassus]